MGEVALGGSSRAVRQRADGILHQVVGPVRVEVERDRRVVRVADDGDARVAESDGYVVDETVDEAEHLRPVARRHVGTVVKREHHVERHCVRSQNNAVSFLFQKVVYQQVSNSVDYS